MKPPALGICRPFPETSSSTAFHFLMNPTLSFAHFFTAKRGEVVAFVGGSGAGKTTLVNLIPRFYDVTSGVILIDGTDIREVSLRSLRAQIAIVTQENILFHDTVWNTFATDCRCFEGKSDCCGAGRAGTRFHTGTAVGLRYFNWRARNAAQRRAEAADCDCACDS